MLFKNSFSILSNRFSLVYKTLFYVLVITLIIVALGAAMMLPTLNTLVDSIKDLELFPKLGDYIRSILSGEVESSDFESIENLFVQIGQVFSENSSRLILAGVLLIILYFIGMFLISMCYYSVSDVVDSYMNSGSNFPFMSNYVHNFKTSAKFALLYTVINIPLQIVLALIIVGVALLFSMVNYLLTIFLVALLCFCIYAINKSIFSLWIPAMAANNMSCVQALKYNFKALKERFTATFGTYFIYGIIMAMLTVTSLIVTFGVGTIVLLVASLVFVRILNMVSYYHINGLKYYKADNVVIDNTRKFSPAVYTADEAEVAEHYHIPHAENADKPETDSAEKAGEVGGENENNDKLADGAEDGGKAKPDGGE